MPLFFIEMGQGIVARGDLRVCTSTLYSCTLIAGYNRGSSYGGAYHYPSGGLRNPGIRADMDVWAAVLRPTDIRLVFAANSGYPGTGTDQDDQFNLRNWVIRECGVVPATVAANGAGMELLAGGGFNAGKIGQLAGNFDLGTAAHVHHRDSGTYLDLGRFTLIGRDRN